jgi:hypothetical protein
MNAAKQIIIILADWFFGQVLSVAHSGYDIIPASPIDSSIDRWLEATLGSIQMVSLAA